MSAISFIFMRCGRLLLAAGCLWFGLNAGHAAPAENIQQHAQPGPTSSDPRSSAPGITSVIELFTSQGCSSCPPADRLFSALARDPNTVALTFPINYWDFIGWKDTLAEPAFTARQKAYAASRGETHVYTPQAVIDGLIDTVGSDRAAIEHATATYRGRDGALSIAMQMQEANGVLHISVGPGKGAPAAVYVVRVMRSRSVTIGRGENSGRTVTYTNVVRAMSKIGEWNGTAQEFSLTELRGEDEGYVVLLQQGSAERPGVILAAAKSANL